MNEPRIFGGTISYSFGSKIVGYSHGWAMTKAGNGRYWLYFHRAVRGNTTEFRVYTNGTVDFVIGMAGRQIAVRLK
jgi:hypothetical protein